MDYSLIEALCIECGAAFERDALLSRHCSMRIGGACDILVKPNSEEMLRSLLATCRGEGIPFFLLGRGSNVLFSDEGYRGCVILLGQEMGGVAVEGSRITAGAGTALSAVCSAALENGLTGLEFAYGIPGSVGGALFMNAGAYGGEMKDVVTSCRYIDENGEFQEMSAEEMNLSYRHSVFSERDFVITSVTLRLSEGDKAAIKVRMDELMQKRRDKQTVFFFYHYVFYRFLYFFDVLISRRQPVRKFLKRVRKRAFRRRNKGFYHVFERRLQRRYFPLVKVQKIDGVRKVRVSHPENPFYRNSDKA